MTKLSLLFLQWTSVGSSPRRTITLGKNYSGFFAFLIRTIREKRSGCKAFLPSSQRKASMLSLKVVVEGATIAAYRTGNCSSSVVCWLRGDDCFFRFSPRRWHDGCSIFPLVHGPVTCRPIDLCCSTVFPARSGPGMEVRGILFLLKTCCLLNWAVDWLQYCCTEIKVLYEDRKELLS